MPSDEVLVDCSAAWNALLVVMSEQSWFAAAVVAPYNTHTRHGQWCWCAWVRTGSPFGPSDGVPRGMVSNQ